MFVSYAAVTNDHKFGVSNSTNLLTYSSQGQKSDRGLKSRCWQNYVPSAGSRGELLLFFHFSSSRDHVPRFVFLHRSDLYFQGDMFSESPAFLFPL